MTNPNNAVGTNAAFGGRTSANAFNDVLAAFSSRGVLSGWACSPSDGMTVALGGDNETRDVAIAMDAIGNKTTINNISEAPVEVTIAPAPSTNSRIDSIVAYVSKPPEGSNTAVDNPAAVGLIAVSGSVASSPSAPSESAIRTAITADGASGTTAYYVVLANITVGAGATVITADAIAAGASAIITGAKTPMPDYSNLGANLFTGTNSATVSEDGFVAVSVNGYKVNANVNIHLHLNENLVFHSAAEARGPNNAVMCTLCVFLPVSKGDTIAISGDGAVAGTIDFSINYRQCYFIPRK